MDRVIDDALKTLADITREEVKKYAGISFTAKIYPVLDDKNQIYTTITIDNDPNLRPALPIVMAQVVDDKVIILEDTTIDKPLVDALVQAGVPREQIVLAYAGETLPTENTD
jgi:hypothetical protein